SYSFQKGQPFGRLNGLNLGLNAHFESGIPINKLDPHPVYLNAGEVPIGGRGSLGRTPFYTRFDLHADYAWPFTEKMRLKFSADFFNLFNSQKVRLFDQNHALDFFNGGNPPNPDFLKPVNYHTPFNMRLGLRFEF